jgi:hypothetical protein
VKGKARRIQAKVEDEACPNKTFQGEAGEGADARHRLAAFASSPLRTVSVTRAVGAPHRDDHSAVLAHGRLQLRERASNLRLL